MSGLRVPLQSRVRVAIRGVRAILAHPKWLALAFVVAFLVLALFIWLPNLELLFEIFKFSGLSFGEKVSFFFDGLGGLFTNFIPLQSTSIVIVSVLVGVNLAMLLAVGSKKGAGRTAGASFIAVFAAGCAACGTSIVAPVIASLVAATSIGFVEIFGFVANVTAIGLLTYSIYKLGLQSANLNPKNIP